MFDDGGDRARHRAQVQEAIEGQKIIAFLANSDGVTGRDSVEYITSKRVPVVGMEGAEEWAFTSPMYFPQVTTGATAMGHAFVHSFARQAQPQGKTKLGTIACVEVEECRNFESAMGAEAKQAGVDHVYAGRASVAQPDFTAECLAARNAGVEILAPMMDQNSLTRIASSCVRQGFRPLFGVVYPVLTDLAKNDPNLDGAIGNTMVFPYFQSGTPATDEFQQAYREFGKGLTRGAGIAAGWVSGKLLERAAANLPEPPTTAALLAGLWSLNGETLGGLTYPLTFIKDQPPTRRSCWFDVQIKNKTWVSPDNFQMHCLDG